MRQLTRVVIIMPGQGLGQRFLPLLDKGRCTSQRRRGRVSQHLRGGSVRIGSGSVSLLEAPILPHAHPLGAGQAPSTAAQSPLIRVIFSMLRAQAAELTVCGADCLLQQDRRSLERGFCFLYCCITCSWSRAWTGRCPTKNKS